MSDIDKLKQQSAETAAEIIRQLARNANNDDYEQIVRATFSALPEVNNATMLWASITILVTSIRAAQLPPEAAHDTLMSCFIAAQYQLENP